MVIVRTTIVSKWRIAPEISLGSMWAGESKKRGAPNRDPGTMRGGRAPAGRLAWGITPPCHLERGLEPPLASMCVW